jgi:hypothetical protein
MTTDRRLIGFLLVSAPHQLGCRERRRLGHPDRFQGKVSIHCQGFVATVSHFDYLFRITVQQFPRPDGISMPSQR